MCKSSTLQLKVRGSQIPKQPGLHGKTLQDPTRERRRGMMTGIQTKQKEKKKKKRAKALKFHVMNHESFKCPLSICKGAQPQSLQFPGKRPYTPLHRILQSWVTHQWLQRTGMLQFQSQITLGYLSYLIYSSHCPTQCLTCILRQNLLECVNRPTPKLKMASSALLFAETILLWCFD